MNKNEELQKWLNDDRYVQVKELAEMWGINISSVGAFLSRNNIKATRILYTGKSVIFAFYDRHKCENARLRLQQKIKGAEDCKSNKMLVPLRELAQLWSISINATRSFLCKHGIKPLKYFHTGVGSDHRAFYDRAECERARPFINQPEQKEVEKVEEKQMELLKNKTIECSNLAARFCGDIAIGRFVMVANELDAKIINEVAGDIICPVLSTQTPQETHDVIKNLIDNNATLLTLGDTDGRLMSIAEAADKGSDIRAIIKFGLTMRDESMPEPKEQVPDIIPADTIDLFTMSELETELKNRGVDLTAEVRAKISASDMPEMQHIAKMLRGNAKTITIRLSVLNEIAGQLVEVKKAGFNWDKWLNPEIEKKEQIKESVLDLEPVFNTEYAKEMFYLLKEVDKNIDNEDIPCEIKEIKKVFARHGSINATECRSVLKKHGYVGMTDAGYLLGMSYAEINNYQKLFLPDYLITLGYDTMAKYKNGRCTSPIWNKTRVDKHFEEIKKNNDFRLDLVKSEISRMGENSRDRLLKMSELDKTSVSEKLDRIISAAWIMGNYDKK